MKFTKFIPMAMAVAFAVTPAFAANTDTVETTLQLTNPEYFNITELPGAVKTATGTIAENAETGVISLSYTTPMSVTYRVVNNMKDKTFYVKAKAQGAGECNAFGGTAVNAMKLVFANTSSGLVPTDAAIGNAAGASPAVESNANAIAFTFTPGAIVKTQGSIADPTLNGKTELQYVAQPGTFELPYTLGTAPVSGTFSSHDGAGTYQAVITVTDTATP